MKEEVTAIELQDRQKARIKSGIAFLILCLILVLPIMSYQNPPPEREGVLVRLGGDFGQGPDNSSKSDATPPPSETVTEEEVAPSVEKTKPEKTKPKKEKTKPKEKNVVTNDNSKELAIKKAKEKKAREQKQKADAAAAAEAKRKAAAAAKRKQEQDAANSMDFGIKNNKNGRGGGDDGKPGTSGSKDGSPDGLSKLGTGNGKVGGGLGARGRNGSVPRLTEKSNKAGTVVVRICVNASGKVISASVTQSGTTIQDAGLHSAAVRNAKMFKFNSSSMDKQCGTVTYKFKVH